MNYDVSFFNAAKKGDINLVKELIDEGSTSFGIAMAFAAREGHIDMVKFLMDCGGISKIDNAKRYQCIIISLRNNNLKFNNAVCR